MSILKDLEHSIISGHKDSNLPHPPEMAGKPGVVELVNEALAEDIPLDTILQNGMVSGMEIVGNRFSAGEYFLPDLLMSAQAMKAGMAILEPLFKGSNIKRAGKVIMGTVQGDVHDIGKNLVSVILEGGGFEIIDLGVDVSSDRFVDVGKANPDAVIGMSALLTTTRESIRSTFDHLRSEGLQNKMIIGGAVVTREFAVEIAADGFTRDAGEVVKLVKGILAGS